MVAHSYHGTWAKLHGVNPLTDRLVMLCFANIPELSADIFAAHGYIRQDKCVIRRIPLEENGRDNGAQVAWRQALCFTGTTGLTDCLSRCVHRFDPDRRFRFDYLVPISGKEPSFTSRFRKPIRDSVSPLHAPEGDSTGDIPRL